jgi:hypothetical protein
MTDIKFDKRNYRKHNDKNKKLIKKSLEECGAGRSIVIDKDNSIIAGNGIYEQAKKLGIKTKIIETDGSELVVVKRTDLGTEDAKRKQLALMDNTTSDSSEFDFDLIRQDFDVADLGDFGVDLEYEPLEEYQPQTVQAGEPATLESIIEALPEELKNTKLEPEKFTEIVQTFHTERERILITYPKEREQELAKMIGREELGKVCFRLEELLGEE